MNKYSDIFKKHKRVIQLNHYADSDFESFEKATEEIIKRFYKDLDVNASKIDELERKITDKYAMLQSWESREILDLVDEQLSYERQLEYLNGYLDSLAEMKIVYLFKSLEIAIKYFIRIAYPDVDVKSFFKWENTKEFFKTCGIDISTIDGYLQCVELKKINNCIKHNGLLNEETRSISEFAGESWLHHIQLESFYMRVNQKIKSFCSLLKEKVKDDLYSFSEERLTSLADDFFERMDDPTMSAFIEKLKGKLT